MLPCFCVLLLRIFSVKILTLLALRTFSSHRIVPSPRSKLLNAKFDSCDLTLIPLLLFIITRFASLHSSSSYSPKLVLKYCSSGIAISSSNLFVHLVSLLLRTTSLRLSPLRIVYMSVCPAIRFHGRDIHVGNNRQFLHVRNVYKQFLYTLYTKQTHILYVYRAHTMDM